MKVVSSDAHRGHAPALEVASGMAVASFETPARAEAIRAALAADPTFSFVQPADHGLGPITAVHDGEMVAFLEGAWGAWDPGEGEREIMADTFAHQGVREGMGPGRRPTDVGGAVGTWCFDTATPIVEGTYAAARAAVDIALTAADAVLAGDRAAYALCRPPGHHAGRAVFGGYCYFNSAAVVAEYLLRATGRPVAIFDVDYHHGNGSQQIFYGRGDVHYVSLHGDPDRAYPYLTGYADETGTGEGEGATFNIPLPAGCDDETYLAATTRGLESISQADAGTLVVSLGIDTYRLDPICDLALTTEAYEQVGALVATLGLATVIVQEGGYHVPDLGENVRRWLLGFGMGVS
jgi:acetoin utilization deacetylase AcuC-like enzyme